MSKNVSREEETKEKLEWENLTDFFFLHNFPLFMAILANEFHALR